MESSNPFVPLYGKIYGPLYFSTLISTGLYGITCMQTFYYYVHYPKDSLSMKSFVAVLWALDTIHEALTVAGVYKYLFAGLVDPSAILDENPEFALQILSETLVGIPVQAFFVYRIYIFSGKNIVAPLLWIIQAIYQIVAAFLYVAKAFYSVDGKLHVVGALVLADTFFMNLTISVLSLDVVVDILIAVSVTFLLLRSRNTTGFANTAHILQRLTVFAVNTGIWTAVFSALTLSLIRIFPSTVLYALFGIPLSSLYCNTLLANLNARSYIQAGGTAPASSNTAKQSEMLFISPTHPKTTEMVAYMDAARFTTAENSV